MSRRLSEKIINQWVVLKMSQRNISNIYKQNQIQSASPKDLVILLYEGCIKKIRLAELALEENRLDLVNENLIKAQDIITELSNTLDMDKGGEIAESLDSLYDYLLNELYQANIHKDSDKMVYVREQMTELLESWKEI